jgi:hypothetical protein
LRTDGKQAPGDDGERYYMDERLIEELFRRLPYVLVLLICATHKQLEA